MVRILGLGRKKKGRKRLAPAPKTPEAIREQYPMYQYALNEFAQTIAPGSGNDDGKLQTNVGTAGSAEAYQSAPDDLPEMRPPSSVSSVRSSLSEALERSDSMQAELASTKGSKAASVITSEIRTHVATRSPFENDMPYATYEELYGEAYTGGPLKYIYPSGYTSMRPRSCPWKLSIVVCVLFTWLSVFIVGHCSDQAEIGNEADDELEDELVRWCGSRPLYMIWAVSMLITGVSAAYCGVIGYIKCRDFAVANSRSQPPGLVDGKSDYYVRIEEGIPRTSSTDSTGGYHSGIYQSDGNPQFWGAHIYRPTQAAVAITHR